MTADPLDQAIAWAVRLGSGRATAREQDACAAWRAASSANEQAWQQVQAVERPFREVPAGLGAAARDALDAAGRARAGARRRTLTLLGLGAGGVALGLLALREAPWQQRTDYASAVGERRRIVLADGTVLQLNTRSAARVVFSPLRRLILLERGEIFVSTGTDEGAWAGRRPFWVQTAEAAFEALGTRFGLRQDSGSTRLHVAEGRVAVHMAGAALVAQPGETLRVRGPGGADGTGGTGSIQRINGPGLDPAAWTQGALVARQLRLDAFVAELARYRDAPLACDPGAAALRVSGVFQLDGADAVERALAALSRALPVAVARGPAGALTVVPRGV